MVSVVVSLCFEFVLTVHIVVGLVFVAFVVGHLVQRRRISTKLLRRLKKFTTAQPKLGRMAASDALLGVLTVAMLVSGFVDVALGHPTQIRWHALLGVALTVYLVVHTLRRRARLKSSAIR
jgi:Flp pilus assembly protein TadB